MSAQAAFTTSYVAALTTELTKAAQNPNTTEAQMAKIFADEYLKAVKKGFNVTINNKLHASEVTPAGRISAYYKTILDAFLIGKDDPTCTLAIPALITAFSLAAIAFWTGARLEGKYKGMPPGHTKIIPPVFVVSPGVVGPMNIPPHGSPPSALPMALGKAYANHLKTITFLVPAIFLPPPASPYPLPLVGIM